MEGPVVAQKTTAFRPAHESGDGGPPAKKIHRVATENDPAWKRNTARTASTKAVADSRPSVGFRRQSGFRDHNKAPLGPRPPDFTSKRVPSDGGATFVSSPTRRSFLPNVTSEPFLGLSARRNTATFDFLRPPMHSPDESTAAWASAKPHLTKNSDTPTDLTLDFGDSGRDRSLVDKLNEPHWEEVKGTLMTHTTGVQPSQQSQSKSRNPALRAAQLSTNSANGVPVATPLSIRTRRQSQVPPANAPNENRPPRKSVGPGLIVTNARERNSQAGTVRASEAAVDNGPSEKMPLNGLNTKTTGHLYPQTNLSHDQAIERRSPSKRSDKAISFTPGSVNSQLHLSPSSPSGDLQLLPDFGRSPGKTSTHLSPAASRRQSTHSSGLGARTISPTDARRLRRVSEVEDPPPLPVPQRSPTPELTFGARPGAYSPGLPRRRSGTPSSSRATPEQNRRFSSGRSLSSRSSFGSLRPPSASQQHRTSLVSAPLSQPSSKSRSAQSPTSTATENEAVPPVPAIPKAFESPSDVKEEPFFANALLPSATNEQNAKTKKPEIEVKSSQTAGVDSSAEPREGRQRRGFTIGSRAEPVNPNAHNNSRQRSSQFARLPPLNLLPLSNPTEAKIASLSQRPSEPTPASGRVTPPPKRYNARTPSTPLTASKATFSTSDLLPFDMRSFPRLPSSTGFGDQKSETSTINDDSPSAELATPLSASSHHLPSPLAAGSGANSSTDVSSTHAAMQDLYQINEKHLDSRTPKARNPRSQPLSKASKDISSTSSNLSKEVEATPSSSFSVRRKMSFGWRRSSSKASHGSQQHEEDQQAEIPDAKSMPPPKIPASAAWNNKSLRLSPNMLLQQSSAEDSDPVKGSKSQTTAAEPAKPSNNVGKISTAQGDVSPAQPQLSSKSSSSLLSPVQRMLGSRSHSAQRSQQQQQQDQQQSEMKLDRDDLAAEDEMKKLASKRKEFEAAAKELDELNKKASVAERLSPGEASRQYNLNIFERGEIIDYKDIFFCGQNHAEKFAGDLTSQGSNFGFDDERGDYNVVVGDHLAYRFEVVDLLGKGSFGQVVRCIDHKTGKLVAVKIIRNKKRFHQQALIEVNILQRLRDWDPQCKHSMINFAQSFYFRGHLCISTELLGMNLYEFIKAHDFRGFSLKLIRRFARQLLSSLCLLQSRNVIHCDLKPENILLAHPLHSEIKVIDFGSSCFENEKVYTYIQSRFYRSPEVILGMNYGMPIDMWSLGCILAELLTGYPIFPGENEQEQLACIMEVIGPPEKHLIEKSTRKKVFFDSLGKPRVTVSSKGKRRRPSSKTLQQALKSEDDAFVDFIARCLRWDPDRRMKPDEAMAHEFITGSKKSTRAKIQKNNPAPSPAKRTPVQTPSRPLPEPPATASKASVPALSRRLSQSPIKVGSAPRRHSTMNNGIQANNGVKVTPPTVPPISALPRSTPRSASGKPDLASAAAIASLKQR